MEKKLTLKTLAKELNVSVSTVSKSLSGSKEISTAMKEKVQKLAKQYNYTPHPIARSLKMRRTSNICVLIPNILANFFAEVLMGIEEEASKHGYNIITIITGESYEKEAKNIHLFLNGAVDGFIVSIAKETQETQKFDHFQKAIDVGYPMVMFDRVADEIHCDKIVIDDFNITYNTTKDLIDSGCRNIIFISTINKTSVGKLRIKGYTAAIKERKKELAAPVVLEMKNFQEYKVKLSGYLDENEVDAIISADELSAVYALNIVNSKGYKIPEEISIVGFTDGILPENSTPPLTTIDQKAVKIGKTSVNTLIKRLNSEESTSYTTQVIEAELVERQSTIISKGGIKTT
ncbi:LacI family DNA-binding transcriptional regulator [Abyssalbus ytuae]|uniref:LacI family transcriptional regulator n=1 Tax=Abyssalbus ytuae TaxID=2926907 RepID=A0A9E7CUG4_9FLAO|nr:LacI family DNA-binding transcriptional regulator [Abyssalbus ytuae]UOB18387.1 LacI family transcriptional regulator [Abyssalbus ytuae]